MPTAPQTGRYLPRFSPPLSSAWINSPPPPWWAGIYPFSLGFDVGAIFTSWLGSVEPYLRCTRAAPPCHHPVITALSLLCITLLQCNAPNIGAFSNELECKYTWSTKISTTQNWSFQKHTSISTVGHWTMCWKILLSAWCSQNKVMVQYSHDVRFHGPLVNQVSWGTWQEVQ